MIPRFDHLVSVPALTISDAGGCARQSAQPIDAQKAMRVTNPRKAVMFAALLLGAATLCPQSAMRAQTVAPKAGSNKSVEIDVAGTTKWVDTNLNVRGGAKLRFTATGKITYPPDNSYTGKSKTLGTFGPAGLARGWADMIHQYAVNDAGHGALIGRIGSEGYAQAFLIGESKEYAVPVAGRLYLGINQSVSDAATATGSFHVKIEFLEEGSSNASSVGGPSGDPRSQALLPIC